MRRVLPVLLLSAAVASSGCSVVDEVQGRLSGPQDLAPPVVTIAVLAPLSGGQTRVGQSVVDAVEQAVDDSGGIPGWEVDVSVMDSAADDLSDDIAEIRADDTAVAVVTGFGADDVRTLVPSLDDAGLTVLSPADTDSRHTRGADPRAPLRPWSGYVTVAVESTPEQSALAEHLVRVVGTSRAVVVHEASDEAKVSGRAFVRAMEERGVADVTLLEWNPDKPRRVGQAVRALDAGDTLVVQGSSSLAARMARQRSDGVVVALGAVPDGMTDADAAVLDGAVAPLPGLSPRRGAKPLNDLYTDSGRDAAAGPYGPAAYDGARMLLDAFTRCLPAPERSRSPSRSACRAETAGTVWNGLTGTIQLDEFGARLGLLPAVVGLRDGEWR
jgi:branched-chain amino acid transport system substrate-binding protein